MKAYIYIENDLFISANSFGAKGTFYGEMVFNTSLSGYQEIISDPSYAGQFIVFSMPEIGIVGTNDDDNESKEIHASGIFIRELSKTYSNFRAKKDLAQFLKENNKIGICDIDTRFLVKMIRDNGNLNAVVSTEISSKEKLKELLKASAKIDEINWVAKVSTKTPYEHKQGAWNDKTKSYEKAKSSKKCLAVLDYGVKTNILNELVQVGFAVKVFPYNTKAQDLIKLYDKGEIHGVFLSNGPGEPRTLKDEIKEIKKLVDKKIPILGICLGHQLLSNAFGYETYKMKFGQHGANHPVLNQENKKIEITAQNHNYNVPEELCEVAIITHRNLFGGNVEGVRYKNYPIISVQHHPESSSGPHESKYIFKEFMSLL